MAFLSCLKVLFVSVLSLSSQKITGQSVTPCGVDSNCDVNIVFVMDSSGSVLSTGWDEEVDFVEGIMDSIGSGSKIGIIEFDSVPRTIWSLCNDNDCPAIKTTLNAGNLAGGGTNIPSAVQAGVNMLNSGCAEALPKVMVVITDGFGGNPCSIDLTGISTYLVKVGSGISNTAVDCLVLNTETDIFESSSFGDIMELTDQLVSSVCTGR